MACNGICHRYKITKGKRTDSWYRQGTKRCTTCDIYIKWEGCGVPVVDTCLEPNQRTISTSRNTTKMRDVDMILEIIGHLDNLGHYLTLLDILLIEHQMIGHFWTKLDNVQKCPSKIGWACLIYR